MSLLPREMHFLVPGYTDAIYIEAELTDLAANYG